MKLIKFNQNAQNFILFFILKNLNYFENENYQIIVKNKIWF